MNNQNAKRIPFPSAHQNQINPRIKSSKSPSPDKNASKPSRKLYGNVQPNDRKYSVISEMEKMRQRREDRKKRIEDDKKTKHELQHNPDYIPKLDLDYERMINAKKAIIDSNKVTKPHITSDNSKIFVCVRKRPIFAKEIQNGEIDCISAINPKVTVYDCKMKIDGITKYIDCNDFYFDNVFNENESTEALYECSIKPCIDLLVQGGVVTCFAYGQTGSGKTYTMKGLQDSAIDSLFYAFDDDDEYAFYVSFFEIYSGRLYDLLNNRNKVMALEDKNQKVQIYGLEEKHVTSTDEMREVVEYANTMRTTHNTVTNETSSRSHAICNFVIKRKGKHSEEEYAKLTLVDLAGSERATETQSNNKSRLAEGAEINKSLLALKECIRALDARKTSGNSEQHVPFRTSKLTLVLRDSFIAKSNTAKIIMISCISPGYSSANHTINTLRYADRLKEKTSMMNKRNNNYITSNNNNNTNNNDNNSYHHGSFINKLPALYNNNNNNTANHSNKNKKQTMNGVVHHHNKKNTPIMNLNPFDDDEDLTANDFDMNVYTNNANNNNNGMHNKSSTIQNKSSTNNVNDNNNNNNNLINNFFDDVEEEELTFEPSPIAKPFIQSHKPKYIINRQKKQQTSKTTRVVPKNIPKDDDHHNYMQTTPNKSNRKDSNGIIISKEDEYSKSENKIINDEVNYINDEKPEDIPDLLEEEDKLISSHMNLLKDEAKLLTEEGNLISQIKCVKENPYPMDEYALQLENIITKKLQYYKELKQQLLNYKALSSTNSNKFIP